MRSNTLRLVVTVLAALAAAGCKKEGVEGPQVACRPVSYVCSADADCCSYGCVLGSCRQNPLEGGACRSSDDCAWPRVCVDEQCTSSVSCRPGTSSCVYSTDCCSGQCLTGFCANDLPPAAVIRVNGASVETLGDQPFRIPIALDGSASTDPNTGTVGLVYAWTVVSAPAGSTAQPSTPALSTTTFTTDVASAITPYVLRLTVTKGGLSGTDTLTFKAVNTPPVITMPLDVQAPAYQSRNVPLATTATVADADGGPITCSWTKTSPTSVVTEIAAATTCASASGQAATGSSTPPDLNEGDAGIWILTLTATDGVNTVTKTRSVNVQNDKPVANAGPKRWGNIDLGAIPLAGTATDVNGDVTNNNQGDADFTWLWTVTSGPSMVGTVVGNTPSASFTPDLEGLYTLTLTVDDGHGGPNGDSATSTVDVQVEPFILPLGEVADAEYVEGALDPERLVVVHTDAGSAYKLTIVNPADLTVVAEVALAARPTALALNFTPPAQAEAIVAEAGGIFQRITGIQSTPVVANTVPLGASALPTDLMDVVHAGTYAYGLTAGGTVYLLDPVGTSGTWWTAVSCPTCSTTPVGTRAVGGMTGGGITPTIWLMQGGSPGGLARYDVHTNGNLQNQVTNPAGTFAGATGVWLSADGADVYTTRPSVFDASTLAQRGTTSLTYTPDHVDTAVSVGSLVGAIAQYGTASLAPFSRTTAGTPFTFGTVKAYPYLGVNGNQVTNYGRFAFVKSGGVGVGGYYAIVRANVGTEASPIWKWGVVNLGP